MSLWVGKIPTRLGLIAKTWNQAWSVNWQQWRTKKKSRMPFMVRFRSVQPACGDWWALVSIGWTSTRFVKLRKAWLNSWIRWAMKSSSAGSPSATIPVIIHACLPMMLLVSWEPTISRSTSMTICGRPLSCHLPFATSILMPALWLRPATTLRNTMVTRSMAKMAVRCHLRNLI